MPALETVDAFFLELEQSPADRATLLILADWYEDHDDPDAAACLRWTVKKGLFPFCYGRDGSLTVSSQSWHLHWYWWAVDDPYRERDWGHPGRCRLPRHVWARLHHHFSYDPAVFKEYPTLRAAYEALFEAWPLVQPVDRPHARERR